ncbi:hypothetical protein [Methyloversatilis universalis]|uniref:hypothetical protein n=1 Tax=Methyloversatilis universalis TaxID=378211 RepID=UPI000371554B
MLNLKPRPDVSLVHSDWDETLYVKDVFPEARPIHNCERHHGSSDSVNPELAPTFDDITHMRRLNTEHTLNRTNCDAGSRPALQQKSRPLELIPSKIEAAHEGANMPLLYPSPNERNYIPICLRVQQAIIQHLT